MIASYFRSFSLFLIALCCPVLADDPFPPPVIEQILSTTRDADSTLSAKRSVLFCWSRPDHPKLMHSYREFATLMSGLLNEVDPLDADTVEGFPADEQWASADLVVFYLTLKGLSDDQYATIDAHLKQGKSIMVLHQGLVHRQRAADLAERIGFAFSFQKPRASKWGRMDGRVNLDSTHPILSGFPDGFSLKDELYWNLIPGTTGTTSVLATTGTPAGKGAEGTWPVLWTVEHPADAGNKPGRVFCSVVGHTDEMVDAPYYRTILLRAMAWCLREPFAPLEPLVLDPRSIHPE